MDEFQQRGRGVGALCGETTHLHKKRFKLLGESETSGQRQQTIKTHIQTQRFVCNTYLRPDHSLKDSVQLISTEAVGVEAVKEVLDPQDAESPEVLQRTDATRTQLQKRGQDSTLRNQDTEFFLGLHL